MSLRRLRILIEHLPSESATKTAMRNAVTPEQLAEASEGARPDLAPWSGTEMLLASLLDSVRLNTAVLVAVNGGPKPDITLTPRPGVAPVQSRRRLTTEERRALDPRTRTQPREA